MPIAKDRTGQRQGRPRTGFAPDPDDLLVSHLVAGLSLEMADHRGYGEGDHRPMAVEGALFRHSDASGCARSTSYRIRDVPQTNPPTMVDKWNMFVGTILHEWLDKGLARTVPGARFEVVCSHVYPIVNPTTGEPLLDMHGQPIPPLVTAGHADAALELADDSTDDDDLVLEVEEYKTQGGFAFKKHSGFQGEAEGPAWNACVQGSLNASALDARRMRVLDVGKELVSKPVADQYGFAEDNPARGFSSWVFNADFIAKTTERELRRVARIVTLIAQGKQVPRAFDDPEVPAEARVSDPETGAWQVRTADGKVTKSGTTWMCGYCWHRDQCIADGA